MCNWFGLLVLVMFSRGLQKTKSFATAPAIGQRAGEYNSCPLVCPLDHMGKCRGPMPHFQFPLSAIELDL